MDYLKLAKSNLAKHIAQNHPELSAQLKYLEDYALDNGAERCSICGKVVHPDDMRRENGEYVCAAHKQVEHYTDNTDAIEGWNLYIRRNNGTY